MNSVQSGNTKNAITDIVLRNTLIAGRSLSVDLRAWNDTSGGSSERPKYTADTRSYLARDRAKRRARCSELCDAIVIERFSRTSEPFALRSSVAEPCADPLLDEGSFELAHRANDVEHQPSRRRAQVEIVTQTDKRYA